jgi:hypothetical protein
MRVELIVDHWSAVLLCGAYCCNNLRCHYHEFIVFFVGTNAVMKKVLGVYLTNGPI